MFLDSSVRSMRTMTCRSARRTGQHGCRRPHVGLLAAGAQRPGVHAERVRGDPCHAAAVTDLAAGAAPADPSAPGAEHRLAAVEERRRPALGVKAQMVGAEHAVKDGGGDVVR